MVVDDQDADGQDEGTSATTVVPEPDVDSTCSRPPASATRSRIPTRPSASARVTLGSKPEPSSSTTATTALLFRCRRMLTRVGAGVLDHVGQRLLDDAVERRLRVARQPRLAELRLQVDPQAALLPERVRQALDGGNEAEVVEGGRAQLDRQSADVLQRRADELADGVERLSSLGRLR